MSETKVVKKRRFKVGKFLCFILFIFLIVFVFLDLVKKPIKNIVIKGNNYITDEEIIETSKIEEYPSFIKTSSSKVCKRIKNIPLIESCKINKNWGYVFEINIKEYKVLFKVRSTDEYVLSNGKKVSLESSILGIPLLINYVTDEMEKEMVEELSLIDESIIKKISEIEYSPTNYDDKRFILYMNDGNMVYITLPKTESLNKYNEIKKELEGKSGVLYLDSGNYFEIKE